MTTKIIFLPLAVVFLTVAGCSSPDPVAYRGLDSSGYLQANPQDSRDQVPFRYSTPVNWRAYDKVIMAPVEIYRGPDAQFGGLAEEDKVYLTRYMQTQFTEKVGKVMRLTDVPGPRTLRIKLTLTGVETNTPVLSTFTRFDLAGGLYNGLQAVRGKEGMMSGSVLYAVEIQDAASNRLLEAAVIKQYPGAYNIGASLGALSAAETGIEKGAEALAAQFN